MPLDTAPRPVSLSDPAWFSTTRRYLPDGTPNPEYGCVFYEDLGNGSVAYHYDSEQRATCRIIPNGPTEGCIEAQGRSFRIAGPVGEAVWMNRKAVA